MSKYDDGSKLAKPIKPPVTVSYKKSRKNSINKEGGKVCRKNALFQHNECDLNPEQALIKSERREPRKGKRESRLDPFMVRQAKLKAKQAQQ